MSEYSNLLDFVLECITNESNFPEHVNRDANLFDLMDSMGVLTLFCDIEEEFMEPGVSIPENVIDGLLARTTSVESFCDMVVDYLLGFRDGSFDDDTVYVRGHDLW